MMSMFLNYFYKSSQFLQYISIIRIIDVHKGAGGRVNIGPHQANFKTLVNKNAIKPEIGGPLWQFSLKASTPPGFWQKLELPRPSPGFSTRVHL
jgi:hypothetical protein